MYSQIWMFIVVVVVVVVNQAVAVVAEISHDGTLSRRCLTFQKCFSEVAKKLREVSRHFRCSYSLVTYYLIEILTFSSIVQSVVACHVRFRAWLPWKQPWFDHSDYEIPSLSHVCPTRDRSFYGGVIFVPLGDWEGYARPGRHPSFPISDVARSLELSCSGSAFYIEAREGTPWCMAFCESFTARA